ncbi:hypothetical protein EJ02DRAFT_105113 [Clathrospora elynae]|uniref:Uncharacterized protein n=1 Tax=Clathrospora elynae TaxID=706981 RepID=A0A6A5SY28_9PLEO|nr:hypothetical protein EJ02DRAFT_105113 [Clathrospora elynae]
MLENQVWLPRLESLESAAASRNPIDRTRGGPCSPGPRSLSSCLSPAASADRRVSRVLRGFCSARGFPSSWPLLAACLLPNGHAESQDSPGTVDLRCIAACPGILTRAPGIVVPKALLRRRNVDWAACMRAQIAQGIVAGGVHIFTLNRLCSSSALPLQGISAFS